MSFIDNLRMQSIYGGGVQPPNLNGGVNLDEISGVLNRIHDYQYQRGKDELNNHLELLKAQNQPALHQIASSKPINEQPDFKVDFGGNATETFSKNIINPSGDVGDIKNKQLLEKRNEFGQNLVERKNEFSGKQDISQQKVDTGERRADTSQYSAETRRQLAALHDLSDSEKLKLLQEGKVDIQHLRDAASLANIGARGGETRKTLEQRGEQNLSAIAAKSASTPQKPVSALNTNRDQFNKARELFNTRQDLRQYIKIDPNVPNKFEIDENTPIEQMNEIRGKIFGKTTDINLPKDKKSDKNNDPLGIRK